MPAWSSVAVRTGTTIGGSRLVAGLENVLNTRYRAHLDPVRVVRPGRNFFVRVEQEL